MNDGNGKIRCKLKAEGFRHGERDGVRKEVGSEVTDNGWTCEAGAVMTDTSVDGANPVSYTCCWS